MRLGKLIISVSSGYIRVKSLTGSTQRHFSLSFQKPQQASFQCSGGFSLEVERLLWLETAACSVAAKANCSLADYHACKG